MNIWEGNADSFDYITEYYNHLWLRVCKFHGMNLRQIKGHLFRTIQLPNSWLDGRGSSCVWKCPMYKCPQKLPLLVQWLLNRFRCLNPGSKMKNKCSDLSLIKGCPLKWPLKCDLFWFFPVELPHLQRKGISHPVYKNKRFLHLNSFNPLNNTCTRTNSGASQQ